MESDAGVFSSKTWKKVLYKHQDVPDNYVDKSFLTEMRKNIYVRTYKYWDLVRQTQVIDQQLCTVSLLIVSWWLMDEGVLTAMMILAFIAPVSFLGCIIHLLLTTTKEQHLQGLYNSGKMALVVLCLTDFLSPILATLTHTISTDTIYAMSVVMILGHLLFHDYSADAALISRAVSLNMSLFSSICLASRLKSSEDVFAFVILALLLFGFWPMLQQALRRLTQFMSPFTILSCTASFFSLLIIHAAVSIVFISIIIFINFACPALLMSLQMHKNNIYGPWDEAVIHQRDIRTSNSKCKK